MDFRYNPSCTHTYKRGREGLSVELKALYDALLNDLLIIKPALIGSVPKHVEVVKFLEGVLHAINLSLERDTLWKSSGKPSVSVHVVCMTAHQPVFALGFERQGVLTIVLPEDARDFHLYPSVRAMVEHERVHEIDYRILNRGDYDNLL